MICFSLLGTMWVWTCSRRGTFGASMLRVNKEMRLMGMSRFILVNALQAASNGGDADAPQLAPQLRKQVQFSVRGE